MSGPLAPDVPAGAYGAATDPEAPVTTAVDGFFIGLAKRSFQVA
jgi:hypothetical protein